MQAIAASIPAIDQAVSSITLLFINVLPTNSQQHLIFLCKRKD
jgi:hypothetical protein